MTITQQSEPLRGNPHKAILARVDQLLTAAVGLAGTAATGNPDPFHGLYLSDAAAAHLASRGPEPLAGTLSFDRPLVDVDAAGPRWQRVAQAFSLAPIEIDVLALALAPELDLRYERVFGYLHDDLTRRRLTPDLASQLLCASFDERLAARHLFAPDAPLMRCGLVHLSPDPSLPAGPTLGHGISLDEGLVEFLLGRDQIDRRLGEAVRWGPVASEASRADDTPVVTRILRMREGRSSPSPHVLLLGPDAAGKDEVAKRAARDLDRPLLVVDLGRLVQLDLPLADAARLIARTARLFDALMYWTHGEALGADLATDGVPGVGGRGAAAERWLSSLDALDTGPTLVAATEVESGWSPDVAHRFVSLEFPMPDALQRRDLWSDRLARLGVALPGTDLALMGEVFQLDANAITRAVEHAATRALWRGPAQPGISRADLVDAARSQIARALPRYATRIPAVHRWDDIILPDDQLEQLRELCDSVRHRHAVLEEWGFARRMSLGRGVAALFSGPSGTGKTMAAQIIAATLGLDLYRVEIPAVVSKYIGETEKALDRLFREAQGTSVILFFDEADALFGKRSEVRDAHDRYANIETSYLLQALEQYEGLTILATNFRHNLDEAFLRRLAFTVTFPFPEEPERRRIWQRSWPEQVPMGEDVDVAFLARHFKLSGGSIRNVALAAAFTAAADGGRVTMTHVVRGVRREYQKLGKVCVEADFGPYFAVLGKASAQ